MTIFVISMCLMFLCVGVHYEALSMASALLTQLSISSRLRVVVGLVAALLAHLCEILLFAVAWLGLRELGVETLDVAAPTFPDFVYFSFASYTTIGYGDIVPVGPARLMAGLEGLVGLVMIAWTASFTYVEMRLYWEK